MRTSASLQLFVRYGRDEEKSVFISNDETRWTVNDNKIIREHFVRVYRQEKVTVKLYWKLFPYNINSWRWWGSEQWTRTLNNE